VVAAKDELFFVSNAQLMVMQYADEGRFVVCGQRTVARLPGGTGVYGLSPDGERVLVGKPVERPSRVPTSAVINPAERAHPRLLLDGEPLKLGCRCGAARELVVGGARGARGGGRRRAREHHRGA
jgi:hypothetical protein